ncbi:MAG: hypothetical protein V4592_02425 [Bacteroidota bacterium]
MNIYLFMENFDHIHIFKTNIQSAADKQILHELLGNDEAIQEWSVDTEDEDCVLRVVTFTLNQYQIIDLLNSKGFLCCELI